MTQRDDFRFVYITARSKDQAAAIGKALIEERLAACVNILDPVTSLYRWNDQVQEGREAVVIAKTVGDQMARLTERVRALHTDACPCIVALPLCAGEGNTAFLDWIRSECGAGN